MQILIIVAAITLGLTYNYHFEGFVFSPLVCLFAGLLMVMPTLFGFELRDAKLMAVNKKVIAKNLGVNFVLLPLIALGIGLLSGDFGLAGGLFLLSILAGGGMVMHWIKTSKGDTKLGFILLFTNLALLTLSFLMFKYFGLYMAPYFDESTLTSVELNLSGAIMPLVIIPFIASRLMLRFAPAGVIWMQKQMPHITKITIFAIIFYLFALENTQVLFDVSVLTLAKALGVTLLFYAAVYAVGAILFDRSNAQETAAFWHTLTRYITLALVVTTFTVGVYGATLILPVMIAYFIQLPLAIYLNRKP